MCRLANGHIADEGEVRGRRDLIELVLAVLDPFQLNAMDFRSFVADIP
jgi:hypothetical protein